MCVGVDVCWWSAVATPAAGGGLRVRLPSHRAQTRPTHPPTHPWSHARRERVPRFAWALWVLLVLEVVMLWRFQPWAVPIAVPPLA